MSLLRKFYLLPIEDKKLFLAAIGLSLIVKIFVFAFPLRYYSKYLTNNKSNSGTINEELIRKITIAVMRYSRYSLWPTKCLVDAITAKLLLQRNGINSTLYLGVNKDKDNKLSAHAWLKCGEKFVTGKKGFQKFTVVSSFS